MMHPLFQGVARVAMTMAISQVAAVLEEGVHFDWCKLQVPRWAFFGMGVHKLYGTCYLPEIVIVLRAGGKIYVQEVDTVPTHFSFRVKNGLAIRKC